MSIPQQIHFVEKLDKEDVQQCFLLLKSNKNVSLDSLIVTE